MRIALTARPNDYDVEDYRMPNHWFNPDSAVLYDEQTRWNGNNQISCATGSQWEHETLYHTAGGRWVIYASSQIQGSLDYAYEISKEEAASWLVTNEHDAIPRELADLVASLEI